ncbi:transposase [Sinorhizobium meliloti]|uniref:transposase n=1 Tax=Rhizobium meliloti TaxID=382 RepID=UPI0018659DF5
MRVEILGQERRRRWGDAKKLDVVMSIGLDGATVTEVAHRHDVSRQQIYAWRHELKKVSVRRRHFRLVERPDIVGRVSSRLP